MKEKLREEIERMIVSEIDAHVNWAHEAKLTIEGTEVRMPLRGVIALLCSKAGIK